MMDLASRDEIFVVERLDTMSVAAAYAPAFAGASARVKLSFVLANGLPAAAPAGCARLPSLLRNRNPSCSKSVSHLKRERETETRDGERRDDETTRPTARAWRRDYIKLNEGLIWGCRRIS